LCCLASPACIRILYHRRVPFLQQNKKSQLETRKMSMKYLAAYALASLSNAKPTKDDVSKIVKSLGVAVDQDDLNFVFEAIADRSINTLIAEGSAKLAASGASASSGSAAPAAAGKAAAPAAKAAAAPAKEEEEDDDFGMGGLF
jgi:large subunit ribosomal protein LP2